MHFQHHPSHAQWVSGSSHKHWDAKHRKKLFKSHDRHDGPSFYHIKREIYADMMEEMRTFE
jgi:hypothetical protein